MKFFSLVLVLAFGALAAHAQIVGGSISGIVRDPNGATVAGASVLVRQVETGASRTLTTAQDGRFYAPSVPRRPLLRHRHPVRLRSAVSRTESS